MSKVKILIVEDELIIAEDLCQLLEQMGYDIAGIAIDYDEAVSMLNIEDVDIVLLDIRLNGVESGFEVAKYILERVQVPYIFLTSHADSSTITKAKQLKPNAFLSKPFRKEDIYSSIEIALYNYSGKEPNEQEEEPIGSDIEAELLIKDSIFVKHKGHFTKLPLLEILYIESDGNYLYIYTDRQKFSIRQSMGSMEKELELTRIVRVHKSFLVNLQHVQNIAYEDLILKNSTKIPIGRAYRDNVMRLIKTLS